MPGDANDHRPWAGIAAEETIYFLGTEPFWSGRVGPQGLEYKTPENGAGENVTAHRFAGRGGLSFSAKLAERDATLMVTPQTCSDGMSDTTYPYTVSFKLGATLQTGCAWTDKTPRQPIAP